MIRKRDKRQAYKNKPCIIYKVYHYLGSFQRGKAPALDFRFFAIQQRIHINIYSSHYLSLIVLVFWMHGRARGICVIIMF